MNALVSRRVALASAIFMASPLRAFGDEPDRRAAPQEFSAIQAAEFEARALRPPPPSVDIPILVYHHVVPDHSQGVLYVTPDGFEQQLKYLRDNDYQSVSFTDLADCLEYGAPLPERPRDHLVEVDRPYLHPGPDPHHQRVTSALRMRNSAPGRT